MEPFQYPKYYQLSRSATKPPTQGTQDTPRRRPVSEIRRLLGLLLIRAGNRLIAWSRAAPPVTADPNSQP